MVALTLDLNAMSPKTKVDEGAGYPLQGGSCREGTLNMENFCSDFVLRHVSVLVRATTAVMNTMT